MLLSCDVDVAVLPRAGTDAPTVHRSGRVPVPGRWRDPAALDGLLRALVTSAEPAVAFTALAAACVPAFANECHVTIVDGLDAALRIAYPPTAGPVPAAQHDGGAAEQWARARIDAPACGTEPAYRATVSFRWHDTTADPRAAAVDGVIARLLAERVADQVTHERLQAAVSQASERADNVTSALASNREIGEALGILMATHKITNQQAFDLVRIVSQNSNRKLRDVADDVNRTGALEPPPPPRPRPGTDSGTVRRAHLGASA